MSKKDVIHVDGYKSNYDKSSAKSKELKAKNECRARSRKNLWTCISIENETTYEEKKRITAILYITKSNLDNNLKSPVVCIYRRPWFESLHCTVLLLHCTVLDTILKSIETKPCYDIDN